MFQIDINDPGEVIGLCLFLGAIAIFAWNWFISSCRNDALYRSDSPLDTDQKG